MRTLRAVLPALVAGPLFIHCGGNSTADHSDDSSDTAAIEWTKFALLDADHGGGDELGDLIVRAGQVHLQMILDVEATFNTSIRRVSEDRNDILDASSRLGGWRMVELASGALAQVGTRQGEEKGIANLAVRISDANLDNWRDAFVLADWDATRGLSIAEIGSDLAASGSGARAAGTPGQAHTVVSPDGGQTWNVDSFLPEGGTSAEANCVFGGYGDSVNAVVRAPTADKKMISALRRTRDHGATWDTIPIRVTDKQVKCKNAVFAAGTYLLHMEITLPDNNTSLELWTSTDDGETWDSHEVAFSADYVGLRARGLRLSPIDQRVYIPGWLTRTDKGPTDGSLHSCRIDGSDCRLESTFPGEVAYAVDFDTSRGAVYLGTVTYVDGKANLTTIYRAYLPRATAP